MSANMHDLAEWSPIGCTESDRIREGLRPCSSLTDPSGTYGTPVVYTEWADRVTERPVLRDYRWFDERECEHYVLAPDTTHPQPDRPGTESKEQG